MRRCLRSPSDKIEIVMAMQTSSGTDAAPYINVTPLIDVLLVLLIIFMVISPLKPTRFEAKVPAEPDPLANQNALPNPNSLVIEWEMLTIRVL
jgi:biopolymer transport protein ExbD